MAQHSERLRVAWIDTDAGGRIHFTVAFRWAEAAEIELLRTAGVIDEVRHYPRRHVEADYLRMLVFDDEVDVTIRVESVGRSSIRFGWEIVHDGEVAITGGHTVVHVDENGRPAPVTDPVRALLTE